MRVLSVVKKIILFIIGGLLMTGLFGCGKADDVKNKNLVSYRYSSGGGMTGGSSSEEINIIDGKVVLTYSDAEWWYEDATVKEYIIDAAVLQDIEKLFRKYRLKNKNGKRFNGVFVADGPSYCYLFKFGDGTEVSFSAQVYPVSFNSKLNEIRNVILKYREKGLLTPGLVTKEKTFEDIEKKNNPDNGIAEIYVYEYSKGRIHYRISNGTGNQINVNNSVKLVKDGAEKAIYSEIIENCEEINAESSLEKDFFSGILDEGFYTLYVGDYSSEFEIGLQNED